MQCDSIFRILIITAYRFYIKQLFNFKIANIHLFDLIHFTISDSAEKDNDAKEKKKREENLLYAVAYHLEKEWHDLFCRRRVN
jgi:hypothetical protein